MLSGQVYGLEPRCVHQLHNDRSGSNSEVGARNRHVRFPPDSDQTADIAGGPVRAKTGSRATHSTILFQAARFGSCTASKVSSFDHLVRTGEKRRRQG